EVEETRKRAFSSFTDNGCLLKQVAVPSGQTQPLIDLLTSTLIRAAAYLGQETSVLNTLSGISPTRFII
ncbi:MAG TPA: hypothetical protein VMZ30_17245, partial [Pyrinomonadaceae bacterium]|nr:hypothetical protein [Pyrinomonadaceae bacterium]